MKRIIRIFVVEAVVLYLASLIASGLVFQKGMISLIETAVALTVASLFVKPIINLLLLPLNLLTFGIFRFLTNAITLFLVDLVLSDFAVQDFVFKGFHGTLFVIPSLHFPTGPFSYIAFSFVISLVSTIIYWILG